MVSRLRRAEISPRNDPHDWNSWDNYRNVHNRRLSEHSFVVGFSDTLVFKLSETEATLRLDGFIECQGSVLLEVTKEFDLRYDGNGRMYVRCYRYRYIGLVPGSHVLLKYHNLHNDPNQYVQRVYDPSGGAELLHEVTSVRISFRPSPKSATNWNTSRATSGPANLRH